MSLSFLGWRLLPDVRPSERGRFGFFALTALLFSLAQTLGLAGSEGIFLATEGVGALPLALIVSAAAAMSASALYAALVGRIRNDRMAVGVFALGAVGLLLSTGWLTHALTRYALFAAFFAVQAVGLIHLRTFAVDYFDTLASKRILPLIAMSASAGGAVGGALAAWLPTRVSTDWLITAWALGLALTAAWVLAARSRLQPLAGAADEDDAPEVRQLRLALRWLVRPGLGRSLALSVAFMVVAMSILHFVSSQILVDHFVTAERLAAFLGLYLGVTNVIEIVLARWGTPFLLRRFGVPRTQLVHPASSAVAFLAVGALPGLSTAILARANRELLENALAGEVRNLAYNAVPARVRGSLRALVEGFVLYGSFALGGLALMAVGDDVPLRWLTAAGLVAVAIYAVGATGVARGYLRRIQEGLREGSLEPASFETAGPRVLAELADEWERIVGRGDVAEITPSILELAGVLARRGHAARLLGAHGHPDPRLRSAVATALVLLDDAGGGEVDADRIEAELLALLADEDASVREAMMKSLAGRESAPSPRMRRALRDLLSATSPITRVEAALALGLGREGREALGEMARSDDRELASAALRRLPRSMLDLARGRCDDPEPEVRAAAIVRTVELAPDVNALSLDISLDIEGMLEDPNPALREAAMLAASRAGLPSLAEALIARLDDREPEVARLAEARLVAMGDASVSALAEHALSTNPVRARAVVRALGAVASAKSRSALRRAFRQRVDRSWRCQLAVLACPEATAAPERLLRLALGNRVAEDVRVCLEILGQLEGRSLVSRIERTLQHGRASQRADALELLGHLGDRTASGALALLLEAGALADKLGPGAGASDARPWLEEIETIALESGDTWIERAWRLSVGRRGDISQEEDEDMNRLLELRRVPLFCHLSLDELQAIADQTELLDFLPGEIVVREGEPGAKLYVLVEGEVDAVVGHGTPDEFRANHLAAPTCFGELAVIDGAPRSATVVVKREARMLVLKGSVLRDIMRDVPQVAIDLLRAVAGKVRAADARAMPAGAGQSRASMGSSQDPDPSAGAG